MPLRLIQTPPRLSWAGLDNHYILERTPLSDGSYDYPADHAIRCRFRVRRFRDFDPLRQAQAFPGNATESPAQVHPATGNLDQLETVDTEEFYLNPDEDGRFTIRLGLLAHLLRADPPPTPAQVDNCVGSFSRVVGHAAESGINYQAFGTTVRYSLLVEEMNSPGAQVFDDEENPLDPFAPRELLAGAPASTQPLPTCIPLPDQHHAEAFLEQVASPDVAVGYDGQPVVLSMYDLGVQGVAVKSARWLAQCLFPLPWRQERVELPEGLPLLLYVHQGLATHAFGDCQHALTLCAARADGVAPSSAPVGFYAGASALAVTPAGGAVYPLTGCALGTSSDNTARGRTFTLALTYDYLCRMAGTPASAAAPIRLDLCCRNSIYEQYYDPDQDALVRTRALTPRQLDFTATLLVHPVPMDQEGFTLALRDRYGLPRLIRADSAAHSVETEGTPLRYRDRFGQAYARPAHSVTLRFDALTRDQAELLATACGQEGNYLYDPYSRLWLGLVPEPGALDHLDTSLSVQQLELTCRFSRDLPLNLPQRTLE